MIEIKEHPILKKGFEYKIIRFNYQQGNKKILETYIDITLQKGEEIRRLRFLSPTQLRIDGGFYMSWGFRIVDSSDKFLSQKIEVEDFECGSIYFRARKVIDLDKVTEIELETLEVEYEYGLES